MNKSEKQVAIDELRGKFEKAAFVAAISYTKLDANTAIELRKAMRGAKIDYKVVKNTLALRAARGTAVEKLEGHFKGPIAVAIAYGDTVAPAKAITEFLKKNGEKLSVRGAVAEGASLDAAGVEALSKMPGLPELRATMLAMINTPAQTLVRLLNTPGGQVARVLQAYADKDGQKAA